MRWLRWEPSTTGGKIAYYAALTVGLLVLILGIVAIGAMTPRAAIAFLLLGPLLLFSGLMKAVRYIRRPRTPADG